MTKRKTTAERELEELTRDAERFLSKKPKHDEETNYRNNTKVIESYKMDITTLYDAIPVIDHGDDDIDYSDYEQYDDIVNIIPQLTMVLNETKEFIYNAYHVDYTTEYLDSMVTDINKILNQLGIEAITLDEIEESEEESADEIEEESADEIEEESAEDSSTYTSADDDTTSSMVSADDATDVSASTNASAAEERSSGITKQGYKNLKNQIFDYQQKSHTTDEDISFYKGIIAELKEFQHDEELASAVFRSLTTSYYKLGKLLYQEEYYDESSQAFTEALKLADPITGSDIIDKLVLNYPELKIVEDDTASSMVSADDITDVSTSTNATDVMGDSFHDDITE